MGEGEKSGHRAKAVCIFHSHLFKELRKQGAGDGLRLEPFSAFLSPLVRHPNALGPRATSGARPTEGAQPEFISGVKRRRRRAGVGSVKRVRGKRAVVLRMSFCGVGNNSPRAPLIPPRGFAQRRDGENGKIVCRKKGGRGGRDGRKAGYSSMPNGRVSARSVQSCPVGSAGGGRLLPVLHRTVVSKDGIPRCLRKVPWATCGRMCPQ